MHKLVQWEGEEEKVVEEKKHPEHALIPISLERRINHPSYVGVVLP